MVKLAGPSWPIFRGLYVWHLSYYHGPLLLSRGILFQVLLSFVLVMASLYWRISSAQVKQKCWNCGFPFLNQQTDHNNFPCIFCSHIGTMISFPLGWPKCILPSRVAQAPYYKCHPLSQANFFVSHVNSFLPRFVRKCMESWFAHQGSLGRRVTLPLYPGQGVSYPKTPYKIYQPTAWNLV